MSISLPVIPPDLPTHDNTMMESHLKCDWMYWLKHRMHQKRHGHRAAPALQFGGIMHTGLDVWYRTRDARAALEAMENAPFAEPMIDDPRTKKRALETFAQYLTKWKNDDTWWGPNGVLATESPFDLSDPDGFRWGGVIDLLVVWNGDPWIVDHKTTSRGGATYWDQFVKCNQFAGYAWAAWKLHGRPLKGVIVNQIVVRKNDEEFARKPFLINPLDIQEWKDNMIAYYHRIYRNIQENSFPRNRTNCTTKFGRCDCFDLCELPEASRARAIEHDFEYAPWDWANRDEE